MKKLLISICVTVTGLWLHAQDIITEKKAAGSFIIVEENNASAIYVDNADFETVKKTAALFQHDIEMVTGKKPAVINSLTGLAKVSLAVVLQKLVIDLGGLKESYLGPPETRSYHIGQ